MDLSEECYGTFGCWVDSHSGLLEVGTVISIDACPSVAGTVA